MAAQPGPKAPAWWEPLWELVVHVLVGSLLFAIIFAPAVGLDLTVKWLKDSFAVSEFVSTLLTWTKYVVGVIDAVLYVAFMANMGWLFLSKLSWSKLAHE